MGQVFQHAPAIPGCEAEDEAAGQRPDGVVRGERQARQQSEKKSQGRAAARAVFVKMSR
jgi:hypothetical protein